MKNVMVADKNGKEVKIGSKVKVLLIDPNITKHLPADEAHDIQSMLNDVLEVYEIDANERVWVEKWWNRGEGKTESHSLALSSSEMELIENVS
jgi:hypothetical protein